MATSRLRVRLASWILLGLVWTVASTASALIEVTYVGDNPWSDNGFPSTGGTGQVEAQNGETATLVKDFTSLGDIPFIVDAGPAPTGGVESIRINERVRNDTGVPWTDFHFVFQSIDANPDLTVEFLNVANPTGEWTSMDAMPGILSLYGLVPAGGIFSISFDLQLTTSPGAFSLFGIHEYPTVPEPAALALVGPGLLGLWLRRRRGAA